MKKYFLTGCLFCLPAIIAAQTSNVISSSVSLAQTSTADSHTWTLFHNPAELGYAQNTEFGVLYENRFFIPQLSTKSVQAAITTNKVNIGVGLSHFGYSVFHEIMGGVALSRNFSNRFSLGVQFNYYSVYFVEYNIYRGALLGQMGLHLQVTDNFSVGFASFNPFVAKLKTELTEQYIPSIYSLGAAYQFSNNLEWRTQIDKELHSNYRFATAFDYQALENFVLKLGGYGLDYFVLCFGLGFDTGDFIFDLNCEIHPLLGVNTLGMIRYKLR